MDRNSNFPTCFNLSRRNVLQMAVGGSVATALSFALGCKAEAAVNTSGYKALVCLQLSGGNNGFNMVVPNSTSTYQTYASSRTNLAIAKASLLSLQGTASDGSQYGLHPSMTKAQSLFNSGHLAILGNVGTLVQPTTLAQAKAASVPLPRQLFSHLDQTTAWMTSIPDQATRAGWGGRLTDLMLNQGFKPKVGVSLAIGGSNYWQEGHASQPYAVGLTGAPSFNVTDNGYYRNGARQKAAKDLIQQGAGDSNLLVSEFANMVSGAAGKVSIINNALNSAGDLSTVFPSFTEDSDLGQQLHMVARLIKARAALDSRQLFYVELRGFDTHNNELATQQRLLNVLSENLNTFWTALNEIGVQNDVTLFTTSDFGRTLSSNGDGSDHAWGNHHLIMGGAVSGGFYGSMPDLGLGGTSDVGSGRILPTTSTDQYAATLARWFGVADADLTTLFPNLGNFPARTLAFL